MANPVIFGITDTTISWYIANLQFNWNSTYYQQAYISISGATPSSPVYAPVTGTNKFTATGSKGGLSPGVTYNVTGKIIDNDGIPYDAGTTSFRTLVNRPSYFFWSYSNISSGANAMVDHRDWNNLTANINALRVFKGLSTYGFTTASPGDIPAFMFNQLVNGSISLTPYMSSNVLPPTTVTGADFYAFYLTNVVTSINSVN